MPVRHADISAADRDRFGAKTIRDGDCLRWTGGVSDTGYGVFRVAGMLVGAHRAAWMMQNEADIPAGLVVMHSCDHRWCVEGRHVSAGTHSDNVRDMMAKGRDRTPAKRNAAKTTCPRGHHYDLVQRRGDGRTFRACSSCRNLKRRG